ncbi:K02A2.6-like [Cordylochernes scorpioides]|uniref:K02A2.6-like n=1 Tax=Cordylochernes scorpioides TaxID=51811 RepID=A0ABY6L325_9ARAC|nr:K02A2.6-like [Cordylochernes scorpioides]
MTKAFDANGGQKNGSRADRITAGFPLGIKELIQQSSKFKEEIIKKINGNYADVFLNSSGDYGRTKFTQRRIEVKESVPIKQAPRRIPFAQRREVVPSRERDVGSRSHLHIFQSQDITSSACREDRSTRFCVDHRKLNNVTNSFLPPS